MRLVVHWMGSNNSCRKLGARCSKMQRFCAVHVPLAHGCSLLPIRCAVCTALSAICHIVSPELVGVFLPQVSEWGGGAAGAVGSSACAAPSNGCVRQPCCCRQVSAHAANQLCALLPVPQVTALLRHDRDLVKKKALLAMQRFLQVGR